MGNLLVCSQVRGTVADDKGLGIKGWLTGPRRKGEKRDAAKQIVLVDKHRIAVLPMTNISPDPQDEYFADGITDELISTLSRIPGLHVIARTSSMKYKGSGKRVAEIGQELRTGSILEGTVRKAGNRLRITAQLVDSTSEESSWSETYDRELGDVFNIQSDIARNVAQGLRVQLHTNHERGSRVEPTKNTEAYSLYLKGRYFWNKGTIESLKKALEQFELATKIDPKFALGYSGLADTYQVLGWNNYDSQQTLSPKAMEFARKAIGLDETIAESHATLGALLQEYERKWEEAERELKRSIELNPSYAWGHSSYGLLLGHLGRFDEAIEEAKRAQELDPFSAQIHCNASEEYLFARQYDKAIEAAEKAIELDPSAAMGYLQRGFANVEKEMYDKGVADFEAANRLSGRTDAFARMGNALARAGRRPEALKIVEKLTNKADESTTKEPEFFFRVAVVHAGLGNNQIALDWLEKAALEYSSSVGHLKSDPVFSGLREEPRYKALLKTVGLDR